MAMVSAGPVKRPATDDDNDETYTPVPAKKARGPTKSSSKRQKLPKAGRSQYVIFKAALAAAAPGENPMDWKKKFSKRALSFGAPYGGDEKEQAYWKLWAEAEPIANAEAAAFRAEATEWAEQAVAALITTLEEIAAVGADPQSLEATDARLKAASKEQRTLTSRLATWNLLGTYVRRINTAMSLATESLDRTKAAGGGERGKEVSAGLTAAIATDDDAQLTEAVAEATKWLDLYSASLGDAEIVQTVTLDKATAEAALAEHRLAAEAEELVTHWNQLEQPGLLEVALEHVRMKRELDELRVHHRRHTMAAEIKAEESRFLAKSLPSSLASGLETLMVYKSVGGHGVKTITATRHGDITQADFASAFPSGDGHTATVSGSTLGVRSKPLRYGAHLDLCAPVKIVRHNGYVTATSSYRMFK